EARAVIHAATARTQSCEQYHAQSGTEHKMRPRLWGKVASMTVPCDCLLGNAQLRGCSANVVPDWQRLLERLRATTQEQFDQQHDELAAEFARCQRRLV